MRAVFVFKNRGVAAGASLEHPHSQVVATPLVPQGLRHRERVARAHLRRVGRCLYCHLSQEELRLGRRMVAEGERFVAWAPFASAHPAETWVVPRRHVPSFGDTSDEELAELARMLGGVLRRLRSAFGDPEYNYIIHSAPRGREGAEHLHWFLQLVPRLAGAAGFELGSGVFINILSPEDAAEALRRAPAD